MYIYTTQQKNNVKEESEEICPAHAWSYRLQACLLFEVVGRLYVLHHISEPHGGYIVPPIAHARA